LAKRAAAESSVSPEPRAIVEAVRHPVRGKVLTALSERPGVTIKEVARRIGESPRRTRHNVEALLAAGLAEVTDEEKRGGVLQRHYGAAHLIAESTDGLTHEEHFELARAAVRLLMADIGAAASAGTFASRPDDFEVRLYGEVDEVSLEEIAAVYWRAYRELGTIIDEGTRRVRDSGESGTEVVAALFHFETALWGPVVDP
jgi:DNA-binding transcriptional ArsR family regulator